MCGAWLHRGAPFLQGARNNPVQLIPGGEGVWLADVHERGNGGM